MRVARGSDDMLNGASLAGLSEGLRAGRLSIEEVTASVFDRVAESEPDVRAFVDESDRRDRVTDAVEDLADRHGQPGSRPTLYGIPVGVKDIFHVAGLPTRAGAAVPQAELEGQEASVVSALRSAGAYPFGKTVTTEFAYYDPGPTRNPHDLDHTPGGSSSGSAAAVAAGMVPLALGTQTYGSVARPASFCGVVGVKPSYGRISREGVLDLSPSADHVGFFTQEVPGARQAASVLYEEWRPLGTVPEPSIGLPSGAYLAQADAEMVEHVETVANRLAEHDLEVERFDLFDDIEAVNDRHHRMVAAEAASVHERWFPEYGEEYGAELRALIEEGYEVDGRELARAREGRFDLREAIRRRMADGDVDLLLTPSAPGPAPAGLDDTGDPVMNVPFTHAGLPTVTLPGGETGGLPLGLQLAAPFGFDEWLLAWAGELEPILSPSPD